ncbi:MAG: tRNA preQ1(34) S-adenosylmethionine ribosyltransferase-isomerase QueA [Verrucomicrobia bacterium]|nr:tRNA preQ1(34) S-adenosylmethionine ribosyltransferase-isomerase QueA [Verrucomicrobiota bacterium]
MKTSLFDYDLPEGLIAQHPVKPRDSSRLMVLDRQKGSIQHRIFRDVPAYLRPMDLLVLNNTKVLPARLFGYKQGSGGKVELLLLEEKSTGRWDALLRSGSRRPDPGQVLCFPEKDAIEAAHGSVPLTAVVLETGERGRAVVELTSVEPLLMVIDRIGYPPLPPYIDREQGRATEQDQQDYQTMYARHTGAVAAPTAGLHFTPEVFRALEAKGVGRTEITLHTGIGTFRPVVAEEVADHRMDEERFTVTPEAGEAILHARQAGGRIVAVGSTSVRTLETVADDQGVIHPGEGRSGLFITPPYTFKAVDAMITNLHLPKSTLLMMVCALAGYDLVMEAYRQAVQEKYRFFSYGDCMLIL